MNATPHVLEFVGFSGAGKSTIARETARVLRVSGIPVSEPMQAYVSGSRRRLRALTKCAALATAVIQAPGTTFGWCRRILQLTNGSFATTMRLMLNLAFVSTLVRRAARHRGVTVLEQGVFQLLSSIEAAAAGGVEGIAFTKADIAALLPVPITVVFVETPHAMAAARAHGRGAIGSDMTASRRIADGAPDALRRVRALVEELSTLKEMRVRVGSVRNEAEGAFTVCARESAMLVQAVVAPQVEADAGAAEVAV